MLRLASSPAVGFGAGAPYCTAGQESFARPRQLKEYDEKVLVEIYRSILARGGVPVAVPAGGPAATATAAATTIRLSTAA
ncbi:hypothetical protein OsJ_11285 [Oryza sativa Japonica Group]|nr:hypothetical protein OsJ_11285 [Oryza sativa Japonica Group]